jgi:hypothetical protein
LIPAFDFTAVGSHAGAASPPLCLSLTLRRATSDTPLANLPPRRLDAMLEHPDALRVK